MFEKLHKICEGPRPRGRPSSFGPPPRRADTRDKSSTSWGRTLVDGALQRTVHTIRTVRMMHIPGRHGGGMHPGMVGSWWMHGSQPTDLAASVPHLFWWYYSTFFFFWNQNGTHGEQIPSSVGTGHLASTMPPSMPRPCHHGIRAMRTKHSKIITRGLATERGRVHLHSVGTDPRSPTLETEKCWLTSVRALSWTST